MVQVCVSREKKLLKLVNLTVDGERLVFKIVFVAQPVLLLVELVAQQSNHCIVHIRLDPLQLLGRGN